MELKKTPINIDFAQGQDNKTDPYQIPIGKFGTLNNTVFDKVKRLTKRNGFGAFGTSPSNTAKYGTTFKNDLIAIGTNLKSYSSANTTWYNKGNYQAIDLSVTNCVRNAYNQSQCDAAIASNGLSCIVYTNLTNRTVISYNYTILDSTTGEVLVGETALAGTSGAVTGTPRVFLLGSYFIVVYSVTISAVEHLQYIAINTSTLAVTGPTDITSSYTSASTVAWDGVVAGTKLFLAWNGASASGIKMASIDTSLVLSSIVNPDSAHTATIVGVTADTSVSPNIIYVGYSTGTGTTARVLTVNASLTTVLSATALTGITLDLNAALYATGNVCTVYGEISDPKTYDTTIPNSYIKKQTITNAGSQSAGSVVAYQVGLASKLFLNNSQICVVAAFQSTYQNSYFVLNASGQVISRIAYTNGGGYLPNGLPSVTLTTSGFSFPYLFKDQIQSVNKTPTAAGALGAPGFYTQTGINLGNFNTLTPKIRSIEMADALNVTGGFLTEYDGSVLNESNFFVWPEPILNADGTYKGISQSSVSTSANVTTTIGSNLVTINSGGPVPTIIGMTISDSGTNIPAGTFLKSSGPSTGTFYMSQNALHTATFSATIAAAVSAQQYYYIFIYQWTDNQGNIFRSAPSNPVGIVSSGATQEINIKAPNLPLTYKISSPVELLGYRWSQAQQSFFQLPPITAFAINDTTAQATTFLDASADSSIVGNPLLYTTGGVIENIAPPATDVVIPFDNRAWLLDAENRNLFWYTKEVVPTVPLEFSDLLTYYVSPTVGGQGNVGPVTAAFPLDDKLIIFSKTSIRYVNGVGPDSTGNNSQYSQPIFITSPVGCDNQDSICQTPEGLMFQSAGKGIWLLRRDLSVAYIGADVEENNSAVITSACTIPETNQVRFSLNTGDMLMFDYFVKQWGVFPDVDAVSSTIYNDQHTIISSANAIFKETPGVYLDGSTPVAISFTTAWMQLGGLRGYQRAYFFYFLGTYLSAHRLRADIYFDYSPTIYNSSTFTPVNSTADTPLNERIFMKKMRCKAFKVGVTELISTAGAGLTLSGMNMMIGFKKPFATSTAATQTG